MPIALRLARRRCDELNARRANAIGGGDMPVHGDDVIAPRQRRRLDSVGASYRERIANYITANKKNAETSSIVKVVEQEATKKGGQMP